MSNSRTILTLCFLALALAGCKDKDDAPMPAPTAASPKGSQETAIRASDGREAFAYIFRAGTGVAKNVILCFHQAGSNAWEYAETAPQFAKLGFDVLAIDQRSGGDMFGHENRTAAQIKGGKEYMDAYADLEGALNWAKASGYKTIVACGSSYSASLTIRLASEHPELAGIMAFSPGEYFDDKNLVHKWAAKVSVPHLYAATKDEAKEVVESLFETTPEVPKVKSSIYYDKEGVHGASALLYEKCPTAGAYWRAVERWLESLGLRS